MRLLKRCPCVLYRYLLVDDISVCYVSFILLVKDNHYSYCDTGLYHITENNIYTYCDSVLHLIVDDSIYGHCDAVLGENLLWRDIKGHGSQIHHLRESSNIWPNFKVLQQNVPYLFNPILSS
jgi:hypothetical protein